MQTTYDALQRELPKINGEFSVTISEPDVANRLKRFYSVTNGMYTTKNVHSIFLSFASISDKVVYPAKPNSVTVEIEGNVNGLVGTAELIYISKNQPTPLNITIGFKGKTKALDLFGQRMIG
jgi:hypothetical protein